LSQQVFNLLTVSRGIRDESSEPNKSDGEQGEENFECDHENRNLEDETISELRVGERAIDLISSNTNADSQRIASTAAYRASCALQVDNRCHSPHHEYVKSKTFERPVANSF
jgi:hypothetical protein